MENRCSFWLFWLIDWIIILMMVIELSTTIYKWIQICSCFNQTQTALQQQIHLQVQMIRQYKHTNSTHSQSASARSKLAHFQQTTRKNHIQSIITSMRQHLVNGPTSSQNNSQNIDIHVCFREIERIKDITQQMQKLTSILSTLFHQCRLMQPDDMYSIMSEATLEHLVEMLAWTNIHAFQGNPKVYVRLQWIVGNYCFYSCAAPPIYLRVVNELLQNMLSSENIYEQKARCLFFSHQQTTQIINLIFYGLCSIQLRRGEVLDYLIDKECCIMRAAIDQARKLQRYFRNQKIYQHDTTKSIAHFVLQLFENFLQLPFIAQQEEQNDGQLQEFRPNTQSLSIIESFDIEIINLLLDMLESGNTAMEEQIAECLIVYLASNLDAKPEILLGHKFHIVAQRLTKSIKTLCQMYGQDEKSNGPHLNVEGVVRWQEQMMARWLEVTVHIFAVNLPEQDNLHSKQEQIKQGYYQITTDWLQIYLLQALEQIMKMIHHLQSADIVMSSMNILQNICSDETLCPILLEHSQLLYLIFSNCKSMNNYNLKTQSVVCMTKIVQVSDSSTLNNKIVAKAKEYDLANIFANNLGIEFSTQINQTMLQALNRLLDLYSDDKEHYNIFWRQLCQQGAKLRLLSILDGQGQQWRNTIMMVEYILDRYDSQAI